MIFMRKHIYDHTYIIYQKTYDHMYIIYQKTYDHIFINKIMIILKAIFMNKNKI